MGSSHNTCPVLPLCTTPTPLFPPPPASAPSPSPSFALQLGKNPAAVAVHTMKTSCDVSGAHATWERVPISPYTSCATAACAIARPYLWLERRYAVPAFTPHSAIALPGCPHECNPSLQKAKALLPAVYGVVGSGPPFSMVDPPLNAAELKATRASLGLP